MSGALPNPKSPRQTVCFRVQMASVQAVTPNTVRTVTSHPSARHDSLSTRSHSQAHSIHHMRSTGTSPQPGHHRAPSMALLTSPFQSATQAPHVDPPVVPLAPAVSAPTPIGAEQFSLANWLLLLCCHFSYVCCCVAGYGAGSCEDVHASVCSSFLSLRLPVWSCVARCCRPPRSSLGGGGVQGRSPLWVWQGPCVVVGFLLQCHAQPLINFDSVYRGFEVTECSDSRSIRAHHRCRNTVSVGITCGHEHIHRQTVQELLHNLPPRWCAF